MESIRLEKQEEIFSWLRENQKSLLIGGASLLLLVILCTVLFFQERADWGKTRAEVEKNLSIIEKLEVEDRGELLALAKSIEEQFTVFPEFSSLYAGRLSQALVQSGAVEEGERLLQIQEKRLVSALPQPFKTFSDSSLLISKGEFEKAWEKELALKEELSAFRLERGDEKWISTLAAFNLVRRAILADLLQKDMDRDRLKQEMAVLLQSSDSQGLRSSLEGLMEAYKIGPKTVLSYLDGRSAVSSQLASEGNPDL